MQNPFGGSIKGARTFHDFLFAHQLTREDLKLSGPVREQSCVNQDAEIELRGDILVSLEAEIAKIMEVPLRNLETLGPLCPNITMWAL